MNDYQAYYLYPSNLFADRQPFKISTLLGSCVAVCLYDKKLKYGGMNHFMVPLWNGEGLASPKYGNVAVQQLVTKMIQLGSYKGDLVAKVFGGAAVLATENKGISVGDRNIQVARQELERFDIKIVAASTGGYLGRKIIFDNRTGEVFQKYIKKRNNTH